MLDQNLADTFLRLLGPKGFTQDAEDLAPWLTDWRNIYHGRAAALVSPATVQDAQAVLALGGPPSAHCASRREQLHGRRGDP